MPVEIDEENLKNGLLGVIVGLVEIIEEVLERQALRRIEGGRLTDAEIERLGLALFDLHEAVDRIKKDNGLDDAVRSVRDGLDRAADELIVRMVDVERWEREAGKQ